MKTYKEASNDNNNLDRTEGSSPGLEKIVRTEIADEVQRVLRSL